MSAFYQAMELNKKQNMQFKAMKKAFKHGQPCRNCGKKLASAKMTVDHIIPVSVPEVDPFDMMNWQVLCIPCHRDKTHKEDLALRKDIKQGKVT